jgi:putative aldouronate transport system permease protein
MREPKSTLKKPASAKNVDRPDEPIDALAKGIIPGAVGLAVSPRRGGARAGELPEFASSRRSLGERFARRFRADLPLYLMALLPLAVVIVFQYFPLYGLQIAFRNFTYATGIWGSEWVGLEHFTYFFRTPYFWRITRNTLVLSFLQIAICFPAPILLALLMNELRSSTFKRSVQTISYMPHFLSTAVLIGIYMDLTRVYNGRINAFIELFGGQRIAFFSEPGWFRFLYISSDLWQGIGWGTIIYLAAISGIDQELYEAAAMDGAGRWRRMWHVTLASIAPTIVVLFILRMGGLLGNDTQKILLMYSPSTYETADVIGTFIYRVGIAGGATPGALPNPSLGTAVGLLQNVLGFFLVLGTNQVARRLSEYSLW